MKLSELLGEGDHFKILQDVDLVNHSTLKLHAMGNLILVKSLKALKYLLPILHKNALKYRPLGFGANQILCEQTDFILIKLKLPFDKNYLLKRREVYHLPASVPLSLLIAHAKKFHLKGWEYMTGIPATVGGAAYMNAGISAGEFGELVKKVYVVTKDGVERSITMNKESYGYRKNHFINDGEIIYAVDLISHGQDKTVAHKIDSYLKARETSQPWKEKTCGCIFKNISKTCRAGHCIDILNLKGLSYKGVQVSRLHGNFFVNEDDASAKDFISLMEIVQNELYLQFGKKFELEVQVLK